MVIGTTGVSLLLQLRKLTGLSKAGQILTDSLGVHGGHTDGVFGVRGQLGEQDGGFLPTNLGLVGKESVSDLKTSGWKNMTGDQNKCR